MSRSTYRANDPVRFTKGAATWWLRNSQNSGSISSLSDVLGNPAATAGSHAPTANSDFTISCATNTALVYPLTSANNGSRKWWVSLHVKVPAPGATVPRLLVIDST